MVENLGDTDGEEKGQKFTPTDWDWVMFLSGEINAIKTRFDTFRTLFIAISCAFMGVLIALLVFLITYSRISASNPDSSISIIIWIIAVSIFIINVCIFLYLIKYRSEDTKMVERLEKCRGDLFKRLNGPNKILECYLNAVGKKDDKNR